ncbi:MAG: hypothetical protein ABJD13_16095 [Paracoccaceae bacterium]
MCQKLIYLSFAAVSDPLSLRQNGVVTFEININRRDVVQALVLSLMIVAIDKGSDLCFELAEQDVILQQDALFFST